MEEEINLADEFGANGTVASEVQAQEPVHQEQLPAAQESPVPQEREHNRIPLSEHLSVRDRAQKAEAERDNLLRQLQAFQQPKPDARPDFWENPEATIRTQAQDITRQAIDPVHQSLSFNNRLIAGSVLGKDAVEAAEKAFNDAIASGKMDPATHARINGHPNPFHAAVEWHRQQQVLEKTGGDLSAYEQRVLEEKLKDPEFLAKAVEAHRTMTAQTRQPNGQFSNKPMTVIQPPRSLSRATGSSHTPSGDVSDEDMAAAFGAA